ISPCVASSATAHTTLTDLGALKVRSNPATGSGTLRATPRESMDAVPPRSGDRPSCSPVIPGDRGHEVPVPGPQVHPADRHRHRLGPQSRVLGVGHGANRAIRAYRPDGALSAAIMTCLLYTSPSPRDGLL